MNQPLDVSFSFQECTVGWIRFTITIANKQIQISASHIYDPFPRMLQWLHACVQGQSPSEWFIDEEGSGTRFLFEKGDGPRVSIWQGELPLNDTDFQLTATINPRQMAEAFISALTTFANSANYDLFEWAHISLAMALDRLVPTLIQDDLLALSARDLSLLIHATLEIRRIPAPFADLKALLKFSEERVTPPWLADDNTYPVGFDGADVPAAWDEWDDDEKRKFLSIILTEGVTSWDAYDLRALFLTKNYNELVSKQECKG